MSATTEFFCRQPKTVDLICEYEEVTPAPRASEECRAAIYSPNGKYFAYTQPTSVKILRVSQSPEVFLTIDERDVYDIFFSPQGNYLCLWCKPVILDRESGVWNKNLKIFNVSLNKVVAEWSNKNQQGWKPQFTQDEKIFAIGHNSKEIHFYDVNEKLSEVSIGHPSYRFKLSDAKQTFQNFHVSPGLNPSVAIFVPEKNGKPANVMIFNIPNFNQPVCSKNFFKAERCQLKWNSLGTALLALASTDHDTTNQSYYGETNLYLLGIAGSYHSRIDLKKEGPIHDITWSPSAREFAVIYGYMPAETTFFDARGNAIHSLPTAPRNTILYSPHARFILVAGFGNLQGTVDIYDRQNKFNKITTFEASNTSVCEWSPCGRFILTATTSPRLRVDNGCKIWHTSGKLIFCKEYQELFSIGWKPQKLESFPPLKQLESAPEPHISVKEFEEKRKSVQSFAMKKPSGAYRPPHARGSAAGSTRTSLYQKELENGNPVAKAENGVSFTSNRSRSVPGAAPVQAAESKTAAKNRKKREAKKQQQQDERDEKDPIPALQPKPESNGEVSPAASNVGGVMGGVASIEEKKIRSLLKKLRAIETLKMKQANGDPLEDTQISKINKEDDIRKELTSLGWSD